MGKMKFKNKGHPVKKNADTPMKGKGVFKKKQQKPDKEKIKQAAVADKKPKEEGKENARKDKYAKMSMMKGEVTDVEAKRRKEQDARTLYVKFTSSKLPNSTNQIKGLHSDIKYVRTPRSIKKKDETNGGAFPYAFLEFGSEDECVKAKNTLSTSRFNNSELIVDFVGAKSKMKDKKDQKELKLNPLRLFVGGLAPGVNKTVLKQMFPKCSHAEIPKNSAKKGTPFGFIQFSNAGDAKAAFDAAQDLDISGHKLMVLYAKITEQKEKVLEKKQERKKKIEAKKKEERQKRRREEQEAKLKNLEGDEEPNAKKQKKDDKKAKTEVKVKVEEKKNKENDKNDDENDEESDDDDDSEENEGGNEKDDEENDDDDENDDDSDDNDEEEEEENDGNTEKVDDDDEDDDDDDDSDDNDEEEEGDDDNDEEDDDDDDDNDSDE